MGNMLSLIQPNYTVVCLARIAPLPWDHHIEFCNYTGHIVSYVYVRLYVTLSIRA